MSLTTDSQTRQTTITVTVTVRVPHGADGDLTAAAAGQLAQPTAVQGVSIEGLRNISPGLSATSVTVRATVELADGVDSGALSKADFVTVESG